MKFPSCMESGKQIGASASPTTCYLHTKLLQLPLCMYFLINIHILSTNSQRWIIMIKLLRTSKNHNFEIICMHAAWCKLSNFCFLLHVLMKLLQNIPVTNFKDHSMWFIKVILCLICLPCTSKMKVVHVFFTREAITSGYCRHRKYYRSARKEFIV